jgi:hypothetical protein
MVLYRGDHFSFVEVLTEMQENLEETKQNIIRQKMDTLFEYITEQKSASLFKNQLSFLKTNSEMVEKYHQDYLRIYFSEEKREIIESKQKNIQQLLLELQDHYTEGEMEEVVRIQYTKIQPIAKYIQSLHYPLMEMEFDKKKGEWILDQREMLLSDIEINHGEPVSVNIVKKKKDTIVSEDSDEKKKDTIVSEDSDEKKKDTIVSEDSDDFFNEKKEGNIFSENVDDESFD